jgi:hypothetical protein
MWMRFQWQRSRRASIAILLLPALLYRAAIPAGFMPMVDDQGQLALVFCPGKVAVRDINDVHAAHHHSHHDNTTHSGDSFKQHVPCPFALSAGPSPLPDMLVVPSQPANPAHVAAEIPLKAFSPTIVRAQSARAPPALLHA